MPLYPPKTAQRLHDSLQAFGGWDRLDAQVFAHTNGTTLRLEDAGLPSLPNGTPFDLMLERSNARGVKSVRIARLLIQKPLTLSSFETALMEQIGSIARRRYRALSHVLAQAFHPGRWRFAGGQNLLDTPHQPFYQPLNMPKLHQHLLGHNLCRLSEHGRFSVVYEMPLALFSSRHEALLHVDETEWAESLLKL